MRKNHISRRQLLKAGSLTALSTIVPISLAAAGSSIRRSCEEKIRIPDNDLELCYMNAVDMAALLRTKKISARELMKVHLKQIGKVNSKVNAFITFVPEDQVMAQCLAADESLANGKPLGPLHGMPLGVKISPIRKASGQRMVPLFGKITFHYRMR
jgi:amidase